MGGIIRRTAELTADRDCVGCAKLVVFCNAPKTILYGARSTAQASPTA